MNSDHDSAGRSGTVFSYPILIRETHLDTFGHVNNATYLQIYEEARWELATAMGFGLEEVRATGIGMTVLETTVRFLRELRLRQQVTVTTRLGELRGKVFILKQAMIDEDGRVASEADFTMALFDLAARRIVPPTAEWLAKLGWTEESRPS
ncbi:MAG TPA: acyl-CoA thioesterase [Rectinemataceae bacterium]|nr:acyl-CoA thioesterase [Rectinemataceae bacterium]